MYLIWLQVAVSWMKGKLSSKESFCYKVASAVKAVKADYHIVIKKKKKFTV